MHNLTCLFLFHKLTHEYDVENFAHEGTSVDYSLQKLYELVGNYNKDGIVLFYDR